MINPTPGLSGRQILLLTLSAAVLVLPLVLVALWVYGKHQWADGQLASLEPRYARVLGMQQQQTEIQEALEQLQGIRAQHVYPGDRDRKSTRLNSSHLVISYAVFCLTKKTRITSNCVLC